MLDGQFDLSSDLYIYHDRKSNLVEFQILLVESPIGVSTNIKFVESPIGVSIGRKSNQCGLSIAQ